MATVTCPKCKAKVNTELKACPKCGLSRFAEAKQNFPRKLVKITLIPFNIFLIVWLLSALNIFSNLSDNQEIVTANTTVSPIVILAILVIGDLLLLGFLWFKKPPKIV